MKARIKHTNDPFQEVEGIKLGYVIYDPQNVEFEIKDREERKSIDWEQVRISAAIAAMQGTITILSSSDRNAFREIVIEGYRGKERTYPNEIAEFAIACADELVRRLKGE